MMLRRLNRWLWFSFVCAATPLTIGVAIFLAWLLTRSHGWMLAGTLTIYGGLIAVVVGSVCVAILVRKSFRSGPVSRKKVARQAFAAGGLLFLNFPVAVTIIASVVYLETRYVVTIVNDSAAEIHSLSVSGGGVTADIGTMAPGSKVRRIFFVKHDGVLEVEWAQNGRPFKGVIDGYVTGNVGGTNS